jgi:hypothetical protein
MDAKVREALTQNAILQVRLDFVERLLNEERAHARQMRWAISVFAIVGAAAAVLSSIPGR